MVVSESSISGLDYNLSTVYQKTFNEKITLYTTIVYQPEANYKSKNNQLISTINPNGGYGGDFEEIDLSSSGLKNTNVKIPSSLSFGLGFGQDKKWFLGLNFGFGIPLAGISSANLGFEFGQRGTNKASLIKEKFFSIRIGVSLNDLWFVRSMYN